MIKYPIEFNSQTQTTCEVNSQWRTLSQDMESQVAIPPEFQGPGGALSPEDLYNHALTNCFIATFKIYAANSKLTFQDLQVESKLVVDLDESRRPVMKDFYLKARVYAPSSVDKARLLAKKACESGFILNSVKTTKHFDIEIVE